MKPPTTSLTMNSTFKQHGWLICADRLWGWNSMQFLTSQMMHFIVSTGLAFHMDIMDRCFITAFYKGSLEGIAVITCVLTHYKPLHYHIKKLVASMNYVAKQFESTMRPLHRAEETLDLDLHNNKHCLFAFQKYVLYYFVFFQNSCWIFLPLDKVKKINIYRTITFNILLKGAFSVQRLKRAAAHSDVVQISENVCTGSSQQQVVFLWWVFINPCKPSERKHMGQQKIKSFFLVPLM